MDRERGMDRDMTSVQDKIDAARKRLAEATTDEEETAAKHELANAWGEFNAAYEADPSLKIP
jgi:hypothetical protein